MSYEDKTKLYTQKELDTVLLALCKLEKESKSALKLQELVKKEIIENDKLIEVLSKKGIIQGDRQAQIFKLQKLNSLFLSLVEKSQNTNKEEGKSMMKEIYCDKHKRWDIGFCTDCRIADLNIYEITHSNQKTKEDEDKVT